MLTLFPLTFTVSAVIFTILPDVMSMLPVELPEPLPDAVVIIILSLFISTTFELF